jgi:hypothetical protein
MSFYDFDQDSYDDDYSIIKQTFHNNFDDEEIDFSCPFIRGFDVPSNNPFSANLATPPDDFDSYLEGLSDCPLPPAQHAQPTPADEEFLLSLEEVPNQVRFAYPPRYRHRRRGFRISKSNDLRREVLKREATLLVQKNKHGDVHQHQHHKRWESDFWSHWVERVKDVEEIDKIQVYNKKLDVL